MLHGVGRGADLKRTLSWQHLTAMGVGAVIGTGIYTLTGIGAGRAGPAVILAFALCGVVCIFAALAYTELATMMPAAGSVYTFSYVALGEIVAWVVGWSLILEYSIAASAVAVGWSGHLAELLRATPFAPPDYLLTGPSTGGLVNLPAMLIVLVVSAILTVGARESANVNLALVALKLVALSVFVLIALPAVKLVNLHPFMPFGFPTNEASGAPRGVMAAVTVVFFAFFGFDAVSTAAEESKNPGRDLPIGIVGSIILCTIIYMAVAGSAVGALDFHVFSKSPAPLIAVIQSLHHPYVAIFVEAAAIIALPTSVLAMMYGQSRIFFAMSRDGLLPNALAKVHSKHGTPARMTVLTGMFVAGLAGFLPLAKLAELSNSGTMLAFIVAGVSMMVMRVTHPNTPRVFRTPLPFAVGSITVLTCLYFMWSLPVATKTWFILWNVVGLAVYILMKAFRINNNLEKRYIDQ
jgi:APA family basic amino acid/polyamine antiporter